MPSRKASIKETGEELSQADWQRFDAAVASVRTERGTAVRRTAEAPQPAGASGTPRADEAPGAAKPDESEDGEQGTPVRP